MLSTGTDQKKKKVISRVYFSDKADKIESYELFM